MPETPYRSERIPLRTVSERPCFTTLREPRGEDELSVVGVDTRSAAALLGRLIEGPTEPRQLAGSDRDTLLAALHRALWGDRIVAPIECAACEGKYDLSLELSALQRL